MKFILSRCNDYELHSKKWIIGYGLLFWLITRIIAVLLMLLCLAVYKGFGINPENLTEFGGNPTTVKSVFSVGYGVAMVLLIAPLLEECIFRLGLSFKRWQIAVAVAAIPAYLLFQGLRTLSIATGAVYGCIAVAAFCVIYFSTSQKFWTLMRRKYFCTSVWISAIAFGLVHLIAFSNFTLELLPYMLCVITVPFFAGCAITYYRVNLGFWWGVGLHTFNNLPAILMIIG